MITQQAEEKRWLFNFDLKEGSDVVCLTEKGRETFLYVLQQSHEHGVGETENYGGANQKHELPCSQIRETTTKI